MASNKPGIQNEDDFVSIPEAAAACAVPRRTLYRWRAAGAVPSRDVGGQVLVSVAAVRAFAAGRRRVVPAADSVPRTATPDIPRPIDPREDGKLASQMFKLFSAGKTPVQVVEILEQPPRAVSALHEQWVALGVPTEQNYDQRLLAVEADHAELKGDVRTKMDLVAILDNNVINVQSLEQSMQDVRRRLSRLEAAR